MGILSVRLVFLRLIAILLLVIPGFMATYGFLEIKNALFDYFAAHGDESGTPSLAWGQLILGIFLFLAGSGFIAGWVFFRDRKRNYVAPKFKEKKKQQRS
jgi:hypothetical protein